MVPAPVPAPAAQVPAPAGTTTRPREVFTLADEQNAAVPEDIRDLYRKDEQGRVLFWTAPPVIRENGALTAKSAALGHSVRYLSDLDEWKKEREAKRKARDEKRAEEAKKRKAEEEAAAAEAKEKALDQAADVLAGYFKAHEETTKKLREEQGLDKWDEVMREVHAK